MIYFKRDKGLFINLYIPSRIEWNDMIISQEISILKMNLLLSELLYPTM